jgi:hypothetical protein
MADSFFGDYPVFKTRFHFFLYSFAALGNKLHNWLINICGSFFNSCMDIFIGHLELWSIQCNFDEVYRILNVFSYHLSLFN